MHTHACVLLPSVTGKIPCEHMVRGLSGTVGEPYLVGPCGKLWDPSGRAPPPCSCVPLPLLSLPASAPSCALGSVTGLPDTLKHCFSFSPTHLGPFRDSFPKQGSWEHECGRRLLEERGCLVQWLRVFPGPWRLAACIAPRHCGTSLSLVWG